MGRVPDAFGQEGGIIAQPVGSPNRLPSYDHRFQNINNSIWSGNLPRFIQDVNTIIAGLCNLNITSN